MPPSVVPERRGTSVDVRTAGAALTEADTARKPPFVSVQLVKTGPSVYEVYVDGVRKLASNPCTQTLSSSHLPVRVLACAAHLCVFNLSRT
jgi:hypothetical protein